MSGGAIMTSTAVAEPRRAFWAVSAALFAISVAATIVWCASMSAMPAMPMPGGWVMSMAWMRMPGQTWLGAGTSFLGMWIVMMVAMMLPSLVPMLRRYRRAVGAGAAPLGRLSVLVGAGYFAVWSALGLAVFPIGIALAQAEMRWPALARVVPIAAGLIVLAAGWLQLTGWKARQLACCRAEPGCGGGVPAELGSAWRHGLRLGLRCVRCCANLTAILLAMGVMDLWAMAVVATAISVERIAPAGRHVARATGAVAVVIGAVMLARAVGLPQ
jgi:predicted metal-binding membrane protein